MSFEDVMMFEKAEADDRTKQVEFTESLTTIARRHSSECSTGPYLSCVFYCKSKKVVKQESNFTI